MQNKKTAFTLVELIVVITILAILGTIAFISMSGYSATSRDSVRLSDASSMRTSLEIYQVNSGKYPLPDQNGYFTLDSETLWWQGKFNGTVIDNLSRNFSEAPSDPLSEKTYTYSVAGNKNEYQLLVLLENDDTAMNSILQTNAATKSRTPKVSGTYNGLYVKTATKFIALPSIITSLDYNSGANSLTGTMMKSMIVNGYANVPNEGNIKYVTGSLDIPETVYSTGTVSSIDLNGAKASVVRMLQVAYSGSNLSNDGIYKYITDLDENDDELLAGVLDTVVLGNAADVAITTSTQAPDVEAPIGGSFTIDEGLTTDSTTINLTITCPSEEGVQMTVYGTGVQTGISYTLCTGTGQVILTSGDGIKEVAMKFKDSEGNESDEVTSNINIFTFVYLKMGYSTSSIGNIYYYLVRSVQSDISSFQKLKNSYIDSCKSLGGTYFALNNSSSQTYNSDWQRTHSDGSTMYIAGNSSWNIHGGARSNGSINRAASTLYSGWTSYVNHTYGGSSCNGVISYLVNNSSNSNPVRFGPSNNKNYQSGGRIEGGPTIGNSCQNSNQQLSNRPANEMNSGTMYTNGVGSNGNSRGFSGVWTNVQFGTESGGWTWFACGSTSNL